VQSEHPNRSQYKKAGRNGLSTILIYLIGPFSYIVCIGQKDMYRLPVMSFEWACLFMVINVVCCCCHFIIFFF